MEKAMLVDGEGNVSRWRKKAMLVDGEGYVNRWR